MSTFRQQEVASNFEAEAKILGFRKTVLFTQSTIKAAQKLYEKFEYFRNPSRDWIRNNGQFLVYEKNI
ncbi:MULTISPECIES: hypothetical protein [Leptospira]|uniref:Uncharacterized protein n=1 Tax=Leptospira santarosai TaxID=28183 RepID=A0AB73MPB5_9LEPT|nr:hypothetical protein B2G51_06025 [Leptospira santarosai]EKO77892.1 hypothetical protein LEP1GSC068_0701 [Leptospira sp. Fiocruz LV3954]EKS06474.1 hypothetical protein LEP1GSC071_1427 [Leptospira santarosai str. JET]EMF89913.1 hypothetical protein LEP1GSC005_0940 [Leptospira santarosai str. ST188]EMI65012.1 hypothetical protein LEP1GSC076_0984 [Leptospira sp. Fiocruz LV4135]EMO69923.1 hypothetical protein LEP1GSC130_3773 [Leptospira santarosai str. 200403458]EMO97871.1 hypothetical protein 